MRLAGVGQGEGLGGEDVDPWAAVLGGEDALRSRLDLAGMSDGAACECLVPAFSGCDVPLEGLCVLAPYGGAEKGPLAPFWQAVAAEIAAAAEAAHPSFAGLNAGVRGALEVALAERVRALTEPVLRAHFLRDGGGDAAAFLGGVMADGGKLLTRFYPVLMRKLGVLRSDGIAALGAVCDAVASEGLCPETAGAGLSDPHQGGRSVVSLTEAGRTLYYKPRPLAIDVAFGGVVERTNELVALPLTLADIAPRDGFGFAGDVKRADCEDLSGVARFYRRLGTLIAAAQALRMGDLTCDNVIAAGDCPVIIDLETVLLPRPRWQAVDPDPIGGSFLLPLDAPNGAAISAVTARSGPDAARASMPQLAGVPVGAVDFVDEIVAGYSEAIAVLGAEGPGLLDAFNGVVNRWPLRPTRLYNAFLTRLAQPVALTDGAAEGLALEPLARGLLPYADTSARPFLAPLLVDEFRQLERGDIPYFTTFCDSRDLVLSTGDRLTDFFDRSGLETAAAEWPVLDADVQDAGAQRIRQLIAADLRRAHSEPSQTSRP